MGVRRWRQLVGYVCLLLLIIAVLCVPLYSRQTPQLFGLPFFYWYQLAWVLITPALMFTAYALMRGQQRGRQEGAAA